MAHCHEIKIEASVLTTSATSTTGATFPKPCDSQEILGDGLLVLWNTPDDLPDGPIDFEHVGW